MKLPNEKQIDPEIRELVVALNEAGLETDWSCQGGPGHMTIRPIIQIRTCPFPTMAILSAQKLRIQEIMARFKFQDYWLSLVFTYGALNTHGGELTWLLQWPTQEEDYLALPAPIYLEARIYGLPKERDRRKEGLGALRGMVH